MLDNPQDLLDIDIMHHTIDSNVNFRTVKSDSLIRGRDLYACIDQGDARVSEDVHGHDRTVTPAAMTTPVLVKATALATGSADAEPTVNEKQYTATSLERPESAWFGSKRNLYSHRRKSRCSLLHLQANVNLRCAPVSEAKVAVTM